MRKKIEFTLLAIGFLIAIIAIMFVAFNFQAKGQMLSFVALFYVLLPCYVLLAIYFLKPYFMASNKKADELQTFLDAVLTVSHKLEQPVVDALEAAAALGDWEYTRQLIQEVQTDYDVNLDYLYSKTPGQTITKETVL
jgi:signal transduction histidine kinase